MSECEEPMEGIICIEPVYRTTPLGKIITQFVLAVKTNSYDYQYISCMHIGKMQIVKGCSICLTKKIQKAMIIRSFDGNKA